MGATTKIQWTSHTFNPWIGCARVSPGCEHCYAEADMDRRRHLARWGIHGTRHVTSESYWKQPLKWDREARGAGERRRVFCASLADVFEDREDVRDARFRLFDLIQDTPSLDWLLLTKRPANIPATLRDYEGFAGRIANTFARAMRTDWVRGWADGGPPANVWLGTSVEDQKRADGRIRHLLEVPATIHFLSVEPLLGPIRFSSLEGIDWAIVGGESGRGARPCNFYWIRSVVDQCRSAEVACFVKQWGARPFFDGTGGARYDDHTYHKLGDPKGGDPDEWPADIRVREFPR